MRYRLWQLTMFALVLQLVFSLVSYSYRLHSTQLRRIAMVRQRGGVVFCNDRRSCRSIILPATVLEVDLTDAFDLDQDVIDAVFALRPTDILFFPNVEDVSRFDLRGLRDLDTLACVELLPSREFSNLNKNIRALSVWSDFKIGAKGFLSPEEEGHLQELTSLRSLTIQLDASELAILRQLRALENLNLHGSTLTNHDLAAIAALPRLRSLVLNSSGIDDQAINAIVNCHSLEKLSICNTHVTAASLPKLMEMSKLEILRICDTSIRSQDFEKAWPTLKELWLTRTQIEPEGEAALRGRMRGTDIIID
jgi:hypothetical protein